MNNFEVNNPIESKVETKIRHADKIPSFWNTWKGTADRALANLTDDIYAYEANNNAYGKGIAIKYGQMNFWYSPNEKMLVSSSNDKITTEELRQDGQTVLAEQLNSLIGKALQKLKED